MRRKTVCEKDCLNCQDRAPSFFALRKFYDILEEIG